MERKIRRIKGCRAGKSYYYMQKADFERRTFSRLTDLQTGKDWQFFPRSSYSSLLCVLSPDFTSFLFLDHLLAFTQQLEAGLGGQGRRCIASPKHRRSAEQQSRHRRHCGRRGWRGGLHRRRRAGSGSPRGQPGSS